MQPARSTYTLQPPHGCTGLASSSVDPTAESPTAVPQVLSNIGPTVLVIAICVSKRKRKKKKKINSLSIQIMYVGNGEVWVTQLELARCGHCGEGRRKQDGEEEEDFCLGPALARHSSSCLWGAGRNLDLRTDMIWKSINIISKTLPRRSIFALRDMKPGLFSLRCGDVTLWEQFGCSSALRCRLKMKLSFIYYPVWK